MNNRIKIIIKSVIIVLLFGINNTVFADEVIPKEVELFVDQVGNKIVSIAGNKKLSEEARKEKIIAIIDSAVDSKWISRFVLGKNYKTISEDQQKRFADLYRSFMINTYGPKFNSYNGKKFSVKSVEKQNTFYVAKAEFVPFDSNQPISLDFRVKENEGKLIIVDFIAEGISLIETQRSEFNTMIIENGIEEFFKQFEKKIEELKSKKGK